MLRGLRSYDMCLPLRLCAQPLFQTHERHAVDAVERARRDPGLAVAEIGVEPAGVGVFRVRVDAQLRAAERAVARVGYTPRTQPMLTFPASSAVWIVS